MKIQIPIPCHEDWNEMSKAKEGRFCLSCQKTVIDFTEKTPAEIAEYFHKNKGQKICGRFRSYQLEREYHFSTPTPLWYPTSKVVSILLASALLLGTNGCFLSENETTGKAKISQQDTVHKPSEYEIYKEKLAVERVKLGADTLRNPVFAPIPAQDFLGEAGYQSENLYIVGTIRDEEGNVIPNVEVFIPKLKASINSDEEGKYSFEIPPNTRGSYEITAKKAGFLPFSAKLNESTFKNESDNQLDIVMKKTGKEKNHARLTKFLDSHKFITSPIKHPMMTLGFVKYEEEPKSKPYMCGQSGFNVQTNTERPYIESDKYNEYSFKVPTNTERPCQIRAKR